MLKLSKSILLAAVIAVGAGFSSKKLSEESGSNMASSNTKSFDLQQTNPEIGVGPFKSVKLNDKIDKALAEKGKILYEGRCVACHKFEERFVGPPLNGITERRNPVWIMNMIINPGEMVEKDPIAKKLLEEYHTPMMNMGVNEEDTRAILEYLIAHDKGELK